MVRCRWCLDITCAGIPDRYHVETEIECPYRGKGKPYDGLGRMFNYTDEEVNFYRINANNFIKDSFPIYYKEMESKNEL
jgi:hypothetical protein